MTNKQTVEQAAHQTLNKIATGGHKVKESFAIGYIKGFPDGAAWQKEQGIDWISCENQKPPLDPSAIMPCSVKVLIWAEDRPVCEGYYFPDFDGWKHSTGNWQPTHFAYINLPKTDK